MTLTAAFVIVFRILLFIVVSVSGLHLMGVPTSTTTPEYVGQIGGLILILAAGKYLL